MDYTIVDDTGKTTIQAADADEAARLYAAREGMRGIDSAEDLHTAINRAGGYGHMEDADGRWIWAVRS